MKIEDLKVGDVIPATNTKCQLTIIAFTNHSVICSAMNPYYVEIIYSRSEFQKMLDSTKPPKTYKELEEQIEELKYGLNNSQMFHCPHFLTTGGGHIACHKDLQGMVDKLKALILYTDPIMSGELCGSEIQIKQWNEFLRCFPSESK